MHTPSSSRIVLALVALAASAPVVACQAPRGAAPASPQPPYTAGVVRADTLARGLEHPWGVAFLPDGRLLVTERPGRLRLVSTEGRVGAPIRGVPPVVFAGQGGLLDVALPPDFARSRLVYLSYSEPGDGGTASTAVARGRLSDDATALEQVEVIYRQQPKLRGGNHFGSRLVFTGDGHLFITQGDRFNYREQAQDPASLVGKMVRVRADGAVPGDNPLAGRDGARPEIWSLGHRNVQGAALEPGSGRLWTIEHGPRGGDELNHPEAGKNYGWPVISYGINYDGTKVGEGIAERAGLEQPVYYWNPVIAPGGMGFVRGGTIPGWSGSLLIGSLNPGGVVRLVLQDGRVTREERYLRDVGRVRTVAEGADGRIVLLTDAQRGAVLTLRPVR